MNRAYHAIAKEGLWVLTGQALAVTGMLAALRMLTETLSPGTFGEFTLGLTLSLFGSQIIFGPIGNGIIRHYTLAAHASNVRSYLTASITLLHRAAAVIVLIAAAGCLGLVWLGLSHWISLVLASATLSITSGYSTAFSAMLTAARRRSLAAAHQGTEPWVKVALAIGGAHAFPGTGMGPLLGYAAGHLLSATLLLLAVRRLDDTRAPTAGGASADEWAADIWHFGKPFLLFAAFTWANLASDRWALQFAGGANEVGLYAAAFMLGYSPMSTLSSMLVQLVTPIIYQRSGTMSSQSDVHAARKYCQILQRVILGTTFLAWMGAWLLHEELFTVFVAQQYRAASTLMPWLILASGIFFAGEVSGMFLNTCMKPRLQMPPKIATAIIGIFLNLVMAIHYGAAGVAYALLAFSSIYFAWMRIVAARAYRQMSATERQASFSS